MIKRGGLILNEVKGDIGVWMARSGEVGVAVDIDLKLKGRSVGVRIQLPRIIFVSGMGLNILVNIATLLRGLVTDAVFREDGVED